MAEKGDAVHDRFRTGPSTLVPIAEVAAALGMAGPSVIRRLKAGAIPARKMGADFVITRAAFERWMAGEKPDDAPITAETLAAAVVDELERRGLVTVLAQPSKEKTDHTRPRTVLAGISRATRAS